MELEQLPKVFRSTLNKYLRLLESIGMRFFDDPEGLLKRYVNAVVFSVFFFPFVATQFSLMSDKSGEDLEGLRVIPVSVMLFLNVVKYVLGLARKSDIKYLIEGVAELWPEGLEETDEKTLIMNKWLKKIGTLSEAFYIYCVTNLFLFEVMPFVTTLYSFYSGSSEYLFPFQLVWEVNSTTGFIVTYLWALASTIPCQLCLYLPFDMIIIILTCDISILFRLLQIDLENCIENEEHEVDHHVASYNNIRDIVVKHQKLLELSQMITNIFGIVLLIHIAFSAVAICFFGFLTVAYGGIAEAIANLLTAMSVVISTFLLALSGQLLTDTSSNMGDAAYNSLWYESDRRIKKLVLIIVTRSQRPCCLSALGFSDMTLPSFSKIMSSAWTYFNLLIQMYGDD